MVDLILLLKKDLYKLWIIVWIRYQWLFIHVKKSKLAIKYVPGAAQLSKHTHRLVKQNKKEKRGNTRTITSSYTSRSTIDSFVHANRFPSFF